MTPAKSCGELPSEGDGVAARGDPVAWIMGESWETSGLPGKNQNDEASAIETATGIAKGVRTRSRGRGAELAHTEAGYPRPRN